MTEYRIVGAPWASLLEAFVRVELEKGWALVGGVAVSGSGEEARFFQALIKPDKSITAWIQMSNTSEVTNGDKG